MKKHGFTLIELLVVISILALLIALLLPVVHKARKQAQAVVRMAQLRQCGLLPEDWPQWLRKFRDY